MARSVVYGFAAGSLESLTLRVWARPRTYGAIICARLEGAYSVYCGNGWEHTTQVCERLEETAAGDSALARLQRTRDDADAYAVAEEILAYALEEWSDPCDEHDCESARVDCGRCEAAWCEECDPSPSALCHYCCGRGYSLAEILPPQVRERVDN